MKTSSILLLGLLLLSALVLLIPVPAAFGSSGHPFLGVVDSATAPTTLTSSTAYLNATAGSAAATTDTGTTGFLTIDFGTGCTAGGCSNTVFSGSVFALYLSANGYSSTAGDLLYAGGITDNITFKVTSLTGTYMAVPETNGTFHIGAVNGHGVLEGPIPAKLSSAYKYIKIYDGSSTSVAVSAQQIHILPGITLTSVPTSGAAGTSVAVTGGGFPASTTIDINYSYTYQQWQSAAITKHGQWITGVSTGPGYFTTTASMLDTKQPINPINPSATITSVAITLTAVTHTSPHKAYHTATATFNENTRNFVQEFSYRPDGSVGGFNKAGPYGNDSGTAPVFSVISAYVTGSIGIQGNFSAIGSTVTVALGPNSVPVTANGKSGMWIANITVPILAKGAQTVFVTNNGVTYQFKVNIVPTLVLTPSSGPAHTPVTVTAYGFAPTNHKAPVILYWFEHQVATGINFWLVNATIGTNGAFNVTGGVQFTVPYAYGGPHDVTASTVCITSGACKAGGSTGTIPGSDVESFAVFTIAPSLIVCNSSNKCGAGDVSSDTVSVNANSRTLFSLVGTGFVPGWQLVNLDGASYSNCNTLAGSTGNFYINFTSAGFRPGLHQFDTWTCQNGVYMTGAPNAWAYFNVNTTGDYVSTQITSLNSTISARITNIQTTLENDIANSQTAITSAISDSQTAITSAISDSQTAITSAITSSQTAITSAITSSQTAITSAITSAVTSINVHTDSAVSGLTGLSSSLSKIQDSVNTEQTYVLVVAVLAAIVLVLVLAVLIRKLS